MEAHVLRGHHELGQGPSSLQPRWQADRLGQSLDGTVKICESTTGTGGAHRLRDKGTRGNKAAVWHEADTSQIQQTHRLLPLPQQCLDPGRTAGRSGFPG